MSTTVFNIPGTVKWALMDTDKPTGMLFLPDGVDWREAEAQANALLRDYPSDIANHLPEGWRYEPVTDLGRVILMDEMGIQRLVRSHRGNFVLLPDFEHPATWIYRDVVPGTPRIYDYPFTGAHPLNWQPPTIDNDLVHRGPHIMKTR